MRNLARGHALSQGRTYIAMDDILIVILTVLSTASTERVTIFDLLLGNGGVLTTSQICDFLDTSKPTALRTMTELKVAGLVDVSSKQESEDQNNNAAKEMRLKEKFEWFLSDEFKQLRESNTVQRCKEKCPPHTRDSGQTEILQWYDSITGENNDEKPQDLQKRALRGGEISLHGIQSVPEPEPDQTTKPLEEWTSSDFITIGCQTIGCIYCINNRGYQGPLAPIGGRLPNPYCQEASQ